MRYTPSDQLTAYATSISPSLRWNAYCRNVTELTGSLTASGWTDITDYVPDSNFSFKSSMEFEIGQYKTDSITITGTDVTWWKNNILTGIFFAVPGESHYIEFKFTLQVGINDTFASDVIIPFSGFLDRNTVYFDEVGDKVTFIVNTADFFLTKMLGERYTMQQIKQDVYSTTDGLVLPNIPGVWVTDANSATPLKPGVTTLTWDNPTDSPITLTLGDGEAVTISTASSNTYDLYNKDLTQKITVATNINYFNPSGSTQDLIVTASATYPHTWNQNFWIYNALQDIYGYAGIQDFSFDNFRLKTYDARKILSYYDIPPDNNYIGDVNCVAYDTSSQCLYMGISDYLYKRNMVTNEYTAVYRSNDYNVVKIWLMHIASDKIYILSKHPTTNAYHLTTVNQAGTVANEVSLTARGTNDVTKRYAAVNFGYVPDYKTSGSIFYYSSNTPPNDTVCYFDLASQSETNTNFKPSSSFWGFGTSSYACAAWGSGSAYFCQGKPSSLFNLFRVESGSAWNSTVMFGVPSTTYLVPVKSGDYNPIENRFIGTVINTTAGDGIYGDVNDYDIYGVMSLNIAYNSMGYVVDGETSQNHQYVDGKVHYWNRNRKMFMSVSGSGVVNYIESSSAVDLRGSDIMQAGQKIAFAPSENKIFGVTQLNNNLYEYSPTSSMYIGKELKGTSLFDMLTKILKAYNLVGTVNANKHAYVFRRANDLGDFVPITTGTTVTKEEVSELSENVNKFAKISYIKVTNGTTSTTYDGTNFDTIVLRDIRQLSLTNELIPDELVKDVAYYFYQFYKNNHTLYKLVLPFMPLFNLEPFDGVEVHMSDQKINVYGSGIIQSVDNKQDGTTTLEILI